MSGISAAPLTAQDAGALLAQIGALEIGSFCLARNLNAAIGHLAGSVVAGSSLRQTGASASINASSEDSYVKTIINPWGPDLPGTWRCCSGYVGNIVKSSLGSTHTAVLAGLFQRIA